MSNNKKAVRHFDNYVTSFCIAGLASLSLMLIIQQANSCPVETQDDIIRAKFYACLVEPSCKLSEIKIKTTTANPSDRKKHLIPAVSKDAPSQ